MNRRGTYLLFLCLPCDHTVQVGRLGRFALGAGQYAYVGSAFGSGGLAARLKHHRHPTEHPHWHIDYLRRAASLETIWYQAADARREHDWSRIFGALPGVTMPISRFGASDCVCPAHLFYCSPPPTLAEFQSRLTAAFPDDPPVLEFHGL